MSPHLASSPLRFSIMADPQNPQKRRASPPKAPPAKKPDPGSKDRAGTNDDASSSVERLETLDLTSQDAFFGAEQELWKKLSKDITLKDALLFAFYAQDILTLSLIFEFEASIVTNDFPGVQVRSDDEDFEGQKEDLMAMLESLELFREFVSAPSVRLEEYKAKEDFQLIKTVAHKFIGKYIDVEIGSVKEGLHEYKTTLED